MQILCYFLNKFSILANQLAYGYPGRTAGRPRDHKLTLDSITENALDVTNLKKRLRSESLLSFRETSELAMRQVELEKKGILRIDLSGFDTTCRFPA